jgi:hypothetical protein
VEQSIDMIRVHAAHAADFTDAEPLLAGMSATLPKGDEVLDPRKMAAASKFPLAPKMTLALTPHRIVVYRNGWGSKVGSPLGHVPLPRFTNIEITWNRKLAVAAFALVDAPPVVVVATEPESAEHFRNRFLELRGRIGPR